MYDLDRTQEWLQRTQRIDAQPRRRAPRVPRARLAAAAAATVLLALAVLRWPRGAHASEHGPSPAYVTNSTAPRAIIPVDAHPSQAPRPPRAGCCVPYAPIWLDSSFRGTPPSAYR